MPATIMAPSDTERKLWNADQKLVLPSLCPCEIFTSSMTHVKLHIPGPVEVSDKTFRAFCSPMIGHRGQGFESLPTVANHRRAKGAKGFVAHFDRPRYVQLDVCHRGRENFTRTQGRQDEFLISIPQFPFGVGGSHYSGGHGSCWNWLRCSSFGRRPQIDRR